MNSGNHWSNRKGQTFNYIDMIVKRYFDIGGVGVLLYAYEGSNTSTETADDATSSAITTIDNTTNMTNTNRKYSYPPYEMKMIYNLQEVEWLILQFGMTAATSFYVEVHLNDCLAKIGRKVMVGDVICFRNMRDDALLDTTKQAIDAYYQVTNVSRAMDGWDPGWRPHILRMQVQPITASVEFSDLVIENPDGTSGSNHPTAAITGADDGDGAGNPGSSASSGSVIDTLSNATDLAKVADANLKLAEEWVKYRNFDGTMLYVLDSKDTGLDYPFFWTGDGVPPNGAQLAGSGKKFPTSPTKDDWFLLLKDKPDVNLLYQFDGENWIYKEADFRIKWEAAGRILESFFNNDNITTVGNTTMNEKQSITKIVNDGGPRY